MADIEKVIVGIEHCNGLGCSRCPYKPGGYSPMDCRNPLMNDALELLKEQQIISDCLTDQCERVRRLRKELSEQPQIVRCKDCRYAEPTKNMRGENRYACINRMTGIDQDFTHKPDWFCADGERKE